VVSATWALPRHAASKGKLARIQTNPMDNRFFIFSTSLIVDYGVVAVPISILPKFYQENPNRSPYDLGVNIVADVRRS
jgi:hypothetical protein